MITESHTRRIEPDITVMEISGRLSLGNTLTYTENAIKKLIAEGCRKLILDLSQLKAVDSAGIGMLLASNGEMERSGGTLRIAGANGPVAQTFHLVHLGRVIRSEPDLASASAGL